MSGIYKGPDGQDLFGDDYEVPSGAVIYTPAPQPEGPSALESLAAIGVASQDAIALRAEVARLTAELAEWKQAADRLTAQVVEMTAELAARTEERDGLAAALAALHELMVEITKDEIECAQSEDGFAVKGWIKVIRLKYEAVDALLENPAVILATRDARVKAEGRAEVAKAWGDTHYARHDHSYTGIDVQVWLDGMAAQTEGENHA